MQRPQGKEDQDTEDWSAAERKTPFTCGEN